VTGRPPAGPEQRERPPITLRESPERSVSGLCARDGGFSLHAATTAKADDARARESLCKYILRPPLAEERLELLDNGLVRIRLKRQFSDGTIAIEMDPLSLLCRLAAAVPPPRRHLVTYAGVLSAAHRWRKRVVPPPPPAEEHKSVGAHAHAPASDDDARPATHRSTYRPWPSCSNGRSAGTWKNVSGAARA
jgi:Putative transposase